MNFVFISSFGLKKKKFALLIFSSFLHRIGRIIYGTMNSCNSSKKLTLGNYSASKNAFQDFFRRLILLQCDPSLAKLCILICILLLHIDTKTTTNVKWKTLQYTRSFFFSFFERAANKKRFRSRENFITSKADCFSSLSIF